MSEPIDPKYDTRPLDELISAALCESDEDVAWNAVCTLHWRGSREVLEKAELLCKSDCPVERQLGADILGQLGVPERTFPNECVAILLRMLNHENERVVLQSIFVAFSHLPDEPRSIPIAARYVSHPDSDVRHAVVLALSGHEDVVAIELLIKLTVDSDSHVRDWATFALGTQVDADTPEIRDALAARLNDSDFDTRGEAIIGLAHRKDQRVVPAIQKELTAEMIGNLTIEAAALIGSPALVPHLAALRKSWGEEAPGVLDDAIAACTLGCTTT